MTKPRVERRCGACGATLSIKPSAVAPVNYCSRACRDAGQSRRVERVCPSCATVFGLRPALVRPVNYCSRACFADSIRGRPPSEATFAAHRLAVTGRPNPLTGRANRGRTGPAHPRYKAEIDSDQLGRRRASQLYPPRPCEVCGATPEEVRIHRHHVDENPRNNEPSNIQFLCGAHHLAVHRARRARGAEAAS